MVPPERQRDLTIAALLRQVLGLAVTQPVIIKMADCTGVILRSTLELLGRCVELIKTARVFVLCSFRPGIPPTLARQVAREHASPRSLSREETRQIICDIAGGKELPCGMQEHILSEADGIPLFAKELTNAVLESGSLRDAGDRYTTAGPLPSVVIPSTLLCSLSAPLDRLGSASKEVAQIGAAMGREFSHRLLAAVAPSSGPLLQSAIDQMAACGLIFVRGEPPDATYICKHGLLEDAANSTMTRSNCGFRRRRTPVPIEGGQCSD